MKKKATAVLLSALLTAGMAASALAAETVTHTNRDMGFSVKVKSDSPLMTMTGSDFYALVEDGGTEDQPVMNGVFAFTAEEVEKATGEKFSTEIFLKHREELQLLERNQMDPNHMDYAVFKPDIFSYKPDNPDERILDLTGDQAVLKRPTNLRIIKQDIVDNSAVGISTGKEKGMPFVYLKLTDKGDHDFYMKQTRPPRELSIALTSKNDILYGQFSFIPLPDTKAQGKEVGDATPFKAKKLKKELEDGNRKELAANLKKRAAFAKGVRFFTPDKSGKPFAMPSAALKEPLVLPENWCYATFFPEQRDSSRELLMKSDLYRKLPGGEKRPDVKVAELKIATPRHDLLSLYRTGPQEEYRDLVKKAEALSKETDEEKAKRYFSHGMEFLMLGEVEYPREPLFENLLAFPQLTQAQISDGLHKLLTDKELQKKMDPYVHLFSYRSETLVTDQSIMLTFGASGAMLEKYPFSFNLNLTATPTKSFFAMYGCKDLNPLDKELEEKVGKLEYKF